MGDKDVDFLRKRYNALKRFPQFETMEYSEDHGELAEWMPLIMEGRNPNEKCAATRVKEGMDFNFGELTRQMFQYLGDLEGVEIHLDHAVKNLYKMDSDAKWKILVKNRKTKERKEIDADFFFLEAGGGTLPLLLKSGIPEAQNYGAFPVSGQWLKCIDQNLINQHQAKVYGKAMEGSPPMSVPHLDTRYIDGKKELLFGPYAGFTTKFLKKGSYLDLLRSVGKNNLQQILSVGINNISLTKYMVSQVTQSSDDRIRVLENYFPNAFSKDWQLEQAGKRFQLIKKDDRLGGVLEFGTEVVKSEDGSLAALLGASPGASTSYSIMVSIIQDCFQENNLLVHV